MGRLMSQTWKRVKRMNKNDAMHRRAVILGGSAGLVLVSTMPLSAQNRTIWSAAEAYDALQSDTLRLIDVRSRAEWSETGVAEGAWPISLHEDNFGPRLFAAKERAGDRTVGLMCAVGGRSGAVFANLLSIGQSTGFVDVSEGMMGSSLGPGWIAGGFPVVSAETALAGLPAELL